MIIICNRGDSIGKLYKIGELAEKSNVSRRTIDYYTKIGLLECERSQSNYRYYKPEAIGELRYIEQCKKLNMSLDDIKQRKAVAKPSQVDQEALLKHVERIKNEMQHLQSEITEIYDVLDKLDADKKKSLVNNLSSQTIALAQTLMIFSS